MPPISGSANADAVDDGLALAGAVVRGESNCDDDAIIADGVPIGQTHVVCEWCGVGTSFPYWL